ncbi:unnamed protein product (macronuclear) [Paramecium tetraurelia]|uniref:Uncharacterized protein n=1 Tax=Paramecium tetraurelia TaxID=5888 RepID=A0CCG3_PARTE|nr:uncharacterized protein GSPATT00037265001 [Paramecium tetraurelia]CAK68480.1 unnamed protein product [Paramecium tetraurelia]|eukprot:XP_001435877.1 hypothetical protein (macronuclear) [Paramecium tetraurelia strain d4-2]
MDQEYDLQLQVTRSKINQKSAVPRFAFQNNQQDFDESLKHLSLQQTRITAFPDGLGKLKKLISLNLNDNYIKQLDYNILDGFKNLEILFIRNNLLQEFQFGKFKHLQQLDISQNHIKKISADIGDLLQLDQLFISHNSFMEIPKSITKLKCIKVINIDTLNVFQLDWFKYGDPGVQELFQSQELIYQLFHTIELCCTGETISAKQLLSSIAFKQFALKYQDKDIQIQYKIHQTILDEDIGMLRILLSEPKKFQIDEINQDDYSPLGLSIWEEKYLAARYLLYANADPNKGASWAKSCLNIAVSKLQYYLVFDLIKRNVGLHEQDIYGNNSIHYLFCVYQMNEAEAQKILQLLLKNGVNGNHINHNGYTPIHLAVQKGYIQVIEYVYKQKEYKFNFRQKTQKQKHNCLHLAVLTRQIYIVKFFIYKFPEFIFQKDYHDLIPIDYLKNDLTIYKYLKGFQKVEIQHILTKNEIFYQSQLSDECDEIFSIKVQSLAQLDNLGLENKIQTTRINEITRQIPLSPNNLKRLEEKNTLMNPQDSQRIQCQIYKGIKKIAYEFDRLQYNNIENLLNQDQFQEQVDDLIQIKKLLYQLNSIKNIIDSNDIYNKQWHFQLKSLKYQINKHVYSERNLEDQKKVSNQLLQIFLEIIKKVEHLFNKKEKIDSLLSDFVTTQFLSIHSGFGLGKLVVFLEQNLKESTSDANHLELLFIKLQLQHLSVKYNIFNQKQLMNIFTI